jgi:hypothetical protein
MMKDKSVNRIITAKDYGGVKAYITKSQVDLHRRGVNVQVIGLDAEPTGTPVLARIWQGQWIADCECGGASFVDPDEPKFFCFGCGNRAHGSRVRPVTFPPAEIRMEIERLVLLRPVNDMAGLTDLERAGMAKALANNANGKPLSRSWRPGESVEDLHAQQDAALEEYYGIR